MKNDYPLWDEETKRFYRWEYYGGAKIKAFAPDMVRVGTPEKQEPPKQPERGLCPFKRFRTRCVEHCALYEGGGCTIAKEPAGNGAAGRTCFFGGYSCGSGCELYNSGCTLIHFLEERTNG